jgi:glycosyltransferase involved in cell wall biosynthesis
MHVVHYRLTCPVATHFAHNELCTRCTGGREYWALLRNCRENLVESFTVALHNTLVRRSRVLTKNISRFIAPSDFTRDWLAEEAHIDSSRITTVMPFVDVPTTSVEADHGEYIAFAGRFAPEKGIHTLVAAAELTGLPFRFCRNESHVVHVKLPGTVGEVITRSRAELETFYRGARMLVMPSEWFETFGLVGAEAMSHGIPVVAARIGALTNLVDDGVNGLLYNSGDPADLAEKVKRLWNDPELCRRLGHAARRKVLAEWTKEKYFETLMTVYQEVTSSARAGRPPEHVSLSSHSNL